MPQEKQCKHNYEPLGLLTTRGKVWMVLSCLKCDEKYTSDNFYWFTDFEGKQKYGF